MGKMGKSEKLSSTNFIRTVMKEKIENNNTFRVRAIHVCLPYRAGAHILSRNRRILWIIIMFNVHVYIQVIYWRLSARRHVFIRVLSLALSISLAPPTSSSGFWPKRRSPCVVSFLVRWLETNGENPSVVALVSAMHASCAFVPFSGALERSLAVTMRICSI